MKPVWLLFPLLLQGLSGPIASTQRQVVPVRRADVVIYGGTAAAVTAAVQVLNND